MDITRFKYQFLNVFFVKKKTLRFNHFFSSQGIRATKSFMVLIDIFSQLPFKILHISSFDDIGHRFFCPARPIEVQ